jgi:hypothetical protein
MGYIALILVVFHLIALGWRGWLAPADWHGWIPPISLVAVIAATIPLLTKGKRIREKQQHDESKL